jgi:hypothetical protein
MMCLTTWKLPSRSFDPMREGSEKRRPAGVILNESGTGTQQDIFCDVALRKRFVQRTLPKAAVRDLILTVLSRA